MLAFVCGVKDDKMNTMEQDIILVCFCRDQVGQGVVVFMYTWPTHASPTQRSLSGATLSYLANSLSTQTLGVMASTGMLHYYNFILKAQMTVHQPYLQDMLPE